MKRYMLVLFAAAVLSGCGPAQVKKEFRDHSELFPDGKTISLLEDRLRP